MKYLITQEQLSRLQNLSMPRHLMEELDELKPIEPLSDLEIATIYFGATSQSLRPQDNRLAHSFAKAIEAHILGEKHDS